MDTRSTLGFLGLGEMGGPMAQSLLAAGYAVLGYDQRPERLAACEAAGVRAAGPEEVVRQGEVVLTSLPSSDSFVRAAEETLLPHARADQLFIEMGTTVPAEVRRLAALFAAKGAALVDAPCSGGPGGVASRTLRIFVGGEDAAVTRALPILEALGGLSSITRCGPSGAGQVVKGVNQLAMGLGAAAYLEAVAFGVRCGVDPGIIRDAVGGEGRWREYVGYVTGLAEAGGAGELGAKFRELPYFLREAELAGFSLPLTEALHAFCDAGERVVVDDHRPAPSFWHELLGRSHQGGGG